VLGSAQRKVSIGSADWALHVQLDDEQTTTLDTLVRSVTSSPCWRFHAGVPMSSVASMPVWLATEKEPSVPREEQEIDVGRVPAAELRLVSSTEPASFPSAHPLSLSARYRWIVDPPRLPGGAVEDKLVSAWSELDRVVEERTKRVKAQIDEAEKHGESVAARLVRIASDMLGFKRGRDERRAELEKIFERKPSVAGPDEARRIVDRLRALETSVAQIAESQRDAERREQEKLHVEEQQRKWEAEQAKNKEDLVQKKMALKEAKEREDRLKVTHREEKDAHQKEKDPVAKQDVEARMLRSRDDLDIARKEVQSLESSVLTIEQELTRPFKPKPLERKDASPPQPASGKGARFVPQPTTFDPVSVPSEALPVTGHLRAIKNQRYLVIQRWEDLAAGESESQRLSAKLVAPQEAQ